MTIQAVQVEHLLSGARNLSGNPLSGGSVYTYVAGTTTLKTTWADPNKNTANSNPITLSDAGTALVFADGAYRFDYYDSSSALLTTRDNLQYNVYGNVEFADGTVGTPSIRFQSESGDNSGWYWVSEGVIGYSSDGVLILTIGPTGITLWGAINYG